MSPESIVHQVESWFQYSRKPGSLNLSQWLSSKGFTWHERLDILKAISARTPR
jgi:hypothetical protein